MGRCAVVIPVGPGTQVAFLRDTLESIHHYMPSAEVVAVNDTGNREVEAASDDPRVTWLSSGRRGTGVESGSLHTVLCIGYARAAALDDLDVMIKMDTDALVVGPGLDEEARAFFAEHPSVGMLGSYRYTCTGAARDFSPAARMIAEASRRRRRIFSRSARRLGRVLRAARRHGYELGEHVLGGASCTSGPALRALLQNHLLDDPRLGRVRVVEDHMLPLCVRSLGFEIADFATGTKPMAIAWRGLPWTVEEIAAQPHKSVIHSVSDWGDQREAEVRRFFAARRQ